MSPNHPVTDYGALRTIQINFAVAIAKKKELFFLFFNNARRKLTPCRVKCRSHHVKNDTLHFASIFITACLKIKMQTQRSVRFSQELIFLSFFFFKCHN